MPEPVIADAIVAPGHDGQAQLVVRVRYENGALGSVVLDADSARKLMEDCDVQSASDLRGHPWQRLLDVVRQPPIPE
jgi:hypothetical protein